MSDTKKTVRIRFDYLQGPIWISDVETGKPLTGIGLIDNDPVLKELNRQAGQMFSSYYEFDSHDQPCWFNYEQEKKDRDIMLELIRKIIARLDEINDGSFVVEDFVTERLKSL